jgi:hypothetical protein
MLCRHGYTEEDIKTMKLFDECKKKTSDLFSCNIYEKGSAVNAITADLMLCPECLQHCRNEKILKLPYSPL